jgi:6,7-dimethyl-8-ribityllumazine synthase
MEISRTRGIPIGNGILTVDNDAQAWKRARVGEGDKGGEAARAALALVRLKRRLTQVERHGS